MLATNLQSKTTLGVVSSWITFIQYMEVGNINLKYRHVRIFQLKNETYTKK